MMLPELKLDTLLTRHAVVEAELSRQLPPETFVKLSREFADIDPVVEKIKAYRAVASELTDLDALIADAGTDPAMREMAHDERRVLETKRDQLAEELRLALLPKDAMDERNVIVEIRAGTGGDEASLFAGDLFRMYERFAAKQGWKVEVIEDSPGTVGGFKEIVAEVVADQWLTKGGFDITKNNMPFPSNKMEQTRIGFNGKYEPVRWKGISLTGAFYHTVSGRNMGKANFYQFGFFYIFHLSRQTQPKTN